MEPNCSRMQAARIDKRTALAWLGAFASSSSRAAREIDVEFPRSLLLRADETVQ
jgi:hypothetical protein